MNFTNGLAKDEFLQHMFKEFPSVFDNPFSRTMLENIVDYGTSDHFTGSKNKLYYFLRDMIPEMEAGDLIPFMDRNCLTNEVLLRDDVLKVLVSEQGADVVVVKTLDQLEAYLVAKGWSVCKYDDGWDLRQFSPAGEDFSFIIRPDNDVQQAIKEIKKFAYDFDADEHVEMWVEARKNNVGGVPSTRALVEDAEAIQEMLDNLADGVNWCEQMTIGDSLLQSSLNSQTSSASNRSSEAQSVSRLKAVNIMWDVDYDADGELLPTEIDIPAGMEDEEEISDYLSDVTGFCHEGFQLVEVERNSIDSLIQSANARVAEAQPTTPMKAREAEPEI